INFNINNSLPTVTNTIWTTTVTNPTVSGSWSNIGTTGLGATNIIYPITAGPFVDTATRNAYRLPAGFLKPAPQDPKAGVYSWLGSSAHLPLDDWEFTAQYIVTSLRSQSIIMLRFVADVQDVSSYDDMFCEGLACRLALEVGPRATQDFAGKVGFIRT